MIVEMVTVQVRAGTSMDYERVFHDSVHMIAASAGYIGHRLLRCLEVADKFVVIVHWQRLEDHRGFNQSPQYQQWKANIHPYYAAPSRVEHFDVVGAGGRLR